MGERIDPEQFVPPQPPTIEAVAFARLIHGSVLKRQYGMQIVWADPVGAGAVKKGEEYVPTWSWFDNPEVAERCAQRYRAYLGDVMPSLGLSHPQIDLDEIWMDSAVAEVNRAERWAIETYGEPEDIRTHIPDSESSDRAKEANRG